MAVNKIYGIYDEATECFVQFLPCINEKIARMTLEKMYKEKRLNIPLLYDFPNTYKAVELGTFDDVKGLFTNSENQPLLLEFASLDIS